ncbi:hypothetical protein [Sphingomonas montana]|uniref:hypothetical protein n=1 Tax=Sphingomonas montana TaxID=1843236 RepID=UPI00096F12B5|nr:hypothetical protein [Sphingomonas montana]
MSTNTDGSEGQRQREEDLLRTRHLRAFSAAAGRIRQERAAEAPILTSQPPLSDGLRRIARQAEDVDGANRSPSDPNGWRSPFHP